MMVAHECKCGCKRFSVYKNVWDSGIVPEEHYEIVCFECGYGILVKEFENKLNMGGKKHE